MKKLFNLGIVLCVFLLMPWCGNEQTRTQEKQDWEDFPEFDEVFDEADRPGLEYSAEGDYFLLKPWNYYKDYNASRRYPLLIYLHGRSQKQYLKNLYYMGMGYYEPPDFEYEYEKEISDEFRKTHPCFCYVPQGVDEWNTSVLIQQIENLRQEYRINTNRIYVHGFSMGGEGSYALANAYYDYNGQLFAGIIRLTGDISFTPHDAVVAKTCIWLQVGLLDTTSVECIQNAYAYLKNHAYNADAVETSELDYMVGTHETDTWTLTKSGMEIAKLTEYADAAHIITEFPFKDPRVMEWLFSKSLLKR